MAKKFEFRYCITFRCYLAKNVFLSQKLFLYFFKKILIRKRQKNFYKWKKNNGRKIDRTGASRTVDRKLATPLYNSGRADTDHQVTSLLSPKHANHLFLRTEMELYCMKKHITNPFYKETPKLKKKHSTSTLGSVLLCHLRQPPLPTAPSPAEEGSTRN